MIQLVTLSRENLEKEGSYCYQNSPNSESCQRKNNWLSAELEKYISYVKITDDGRLRGFIEFAEAFYFSRMVYADLYMVIHCLWVSPGYEYDSRLIHHCLEESERLGKQGIAVIVNSGNTWKSYKEIFLKSGFKTVDKAPGGYELLALKLHSDAYDPFFPYDWEEQLNRYKRLTLLRAFQCPYVQSVAVNFDKAAVALHHMSDGIDDPHSRDALFPLSPTPYGVFGAVCDDTLISTHRLTVQALVEQLKNRTSR
ncbi:GNAT family N-acetyltransferase [Paenibacillus rhizophilus]|uniref:GNAT family N-acetyltransferase n=1 Tax=Paenibacillus rhizophilus TaxID=1850366 RepID=A0A3N9PW96_9BACL|nr:GNAT family N-acetyltransferase [Paenibacillus rhizophilus]RQW09526.1 GNAT family N-acetyltransferase [Paenibacillus rhizophilus]